MEINEFISSGIIELYCMGAASEVETKLVEKLAAENKEVRDEIVAVNEALQLFAAASRKTPAGQLKNKIMTALGNQFPPRLSPASKAEEWKSYLEKNSIIPPENYEQIHLVDLPGNETMTTYVVWARKGSVVEESHSDEDEYLFMLNGYCSITIDGKLNYYKEGDIAFIPKGAVHRAEALSDEPMLIIGQRVAA